MTNFNIGEYIEVHIGDGSYDDEGYSYFFKMDLEGYDEMDIVNVFIKEGNVQYVEVVDDESAISWAGDNKFSDFLNK